MGLVNRATWSGERAQVFARGLYHVAACDGLHPRERLALEAFLEQVGLPGGVDALAEQPFDYVEAARVLDSAWLRRVFIDACRVMAQMDGAVTGPERDALRAMGAALGVGERHALASFEPQQLEPEDLLAWVAAQQVDLVSWDDDAQSGYFWPFPHPQHPLRHGGAVQVLPGQALVVRAGGAITDVLLPGDHEVKPETLPGLARAVGWAGGPVEAGLLFVKLGPTKLLRWGTSQAVTLQVPGMGAVPVRAYGRFSLRLAEARPLVERFARAAVPEPEDVEARLRRLVEGRFAEGLSNLTFSSRDHLVEALNDLDVLRDSLVSHLKETLGRAGLGVRKFVIENLTGPLELGLRPISKRTQSLTEIGRALNLTSTSLPDVASEPPAQLLAACVDCLAPTPIGARFCATCGAAQRRSCPACGHEVPHRARFCSDCGHQLTGP